MHLKALLKIPRLYDSHTHWLGTGQVANGLQLFALSAADDLRKIQIEPTHFRSDWLVGFGWGSGNWSDGNTPDKVLLDELFPNFPVFFSKADGHSSCLNSLAVSRLGLPASHSGFLSEGEHFTAYSSLPAYSDQQVSAALQKATAIFNRAGFTHIRDMTCDPQQWEQAVKLDQAGELTLYVEENFLCETPAVLERTLQSLGAAKQQQTPHLKVQGIKIFFDGTLGSDTALLSQCACQTKNSGWTAEDLEILLKETWSKGFEVSVHTIGDEAVHQVVSVARKVMAANQHTGWLNLEHVQVLRPETLQMMKALHVRCHMQPCHWLGDRLWLKEKLGELYKYAFPWGALSRSGIPLYFGSDSPVAPASFWDNERALRESAKAKIPALKGRAIEFHTHPVPTRSETYTVFEEHELQEVVFEGRALNVGFKDSTR
jgi:hypothetical protein